METMDFFSIITLISGILSILLFIIVWTMSNNVEKIAGDIKKMARQSTLYDTKEVARAILKNDPDIDNTLFNALYYDLLKGYMENGGSPKNTLDQFQGIYKSLNKPFPAVFQGIKSYRDFEQLINSATNPKEPIANSLTENV